MNEIGVQNTSLQAILGKQLGSSGPNIFFSLMKKAYFNFCLYPYL